MMVINNNLLVYDDHTLSEFGFLFVYEDDIHCHVS